jgi:hypothetical protein
MKEQLKQLGFHCKLSVLVDISSNFKFENHKNLLQLINLFNSINAMEVANEHNLFGGISIKTTE